MAALPYMQLYVADYLADTMHLNTEEHGAYLLLIFNYWQTGKPLPNIPSRLSTIARLSSERWTDVEQTLKEFFVIKDGLWIHPRIEADLQYMEMKQKQASDAGKASAKARMSKKQAKINARSTDVKTDDATPVSTKTSTKPQRKSNHSDPDPDPYSDTDNIGQKRSRFVPPSVSDVTEYCLSRSNSVSPEAFCDFYSAKGWMIGKNKMKDWKAAVRTWEKSENSSGNDYMKGMK